MHNKTNPLSLLLSLLSGALLAFAFAPTHLFFLAYCCPAVLLYLLIKNNHRAAFWHGLLFGLGFFGLGASWVFVSVHKYGNASLFLSIAITFLFVLYLALYPALMSYVFRRFFKNTHQTLQCLIAFPALWVVFEWLRAWVFTGFPWLFLGYSQTDFVLKNLAPLLSVYGVSFITALISGLIVCFFHKKMFWKRAAITTAIVGICIGSWMLSLLHWTKPIKQPIKVSLIQGNIPLRLKWDADYLQHILQIYTQETQKHWDSPLIIWPEAAIPAVTQRVANYLNYMDQHARKHHTAIILGIPTYNPRSMAYFNSLKVIGDGKGLYNKRHLVPFGEYIPLSAIFAPIMNRLNIPMSGFTKGSYAQKPLNALHLKIAPFICYEVAFPQEVLRFSRKSNLIVIASDDSWFGASFASAQQLQMAQMRAIETGRPILYSTNNGITAVISPQGNLIKRLPKNQRATLTVMVQPVQGSTLAMRWHNLLIGITVISSLLIVFLLNLRRQRRGGRH